MTSVEYAGHNVELNDEGFLVDSSQWTPEVAEAIAEEVGVGKLSDKHWQVITFCREDAAREGQPPGLRRISKQSGVNMKVAALIMDGAEMRVRADINWLEHVERKIVRTF